MNTPLLAADSIDWVDADYDCEQPLFFQESGVWQFDHQTVNMPSALLDLVDRGDALWGVEVRSVRTFYADLFCAGPRQSSHRVTLPPGVVKASDLVAKPGLVAANYCELDASSEGLNPIWKRDPPIGIPKGTWLARGAVWDLAGSVLESLIVFVEDPDLGEHQMRRELSEQAGHPQWRIKLHPDVLKIVRSSPEKAPLPNALTLVGFAAALGDTDNWRAYTRDESSGRDEEPIVAEVNSHISRRDKNAALIGEEDFDPLYAATLLFDEKLANLKAAATAPQEEP